jgi:hypothetical protein
MLFRWLVALPDKIAAGASTHIGSQCYRMFATSMSSIRNSAACAYRSGFRLDFKAAPISDRPGPEVQLSQKADRAVGGWRSTATADDFVTGAWPYTAAAVRCQREPHGHWLAGSVRRTCVRVARLHGNFFSYQVLPCNLVSSKSLRIWTKNAGPSLSYRRSRRIRPRSERFPLRQRNGNTWSHPAKAGLVPAGHVPGAHVICACVRRIRPARTSNLATGSSEIKSPTRY